MQKASMAVVKETIDTAEQKANDLIATMDQAELQQAAQPHLGGSIGLKV